MTYIYRHSISINTALREFGCKELSNGLYWSNGFKSKPICIDMSTGELKENDMETEMSVRGVFSKL